MASRPAFILTPHHARDIRLVGGGSIGSQLRVNGGTVWLTLRAQGVRMRDAKGREQ
jgi:hypothetical protein